MARPGNSNGKQQAKLSFSGRSNELATSSFKRSYTQKGKDALPRKQAKIDWDKTRATSSFAPQASATEKPSLYASTEVLSPSLRENPTTREATTYNLRSSIIASSKRNEIIQSHPPSKVVRSPISKGAIPTHSSGPKTATISSRVAASHTKDPDDAEDVFSTSSYTAPGNGRPEELTHARQLNVWVDAEDRVLLLEDVTSADAVTQTWIGGDQEAILLDDGQYLDTSGLTDEEINHWDAAIEIAEPGNVRSYSCSHFEVDFLRRKIIDAFRSSDPDLSRFFDNPTHTADLSEITEEFEEFAWHENAISGWKKAHLVRPSGKPSAFVHLQLHYPTFTTKFPNNGETLDATNSCVKLLMDKGYNEDNAFWYESYFRRQVASTVRHLPNVAQEWPARVRTLHEDFSSMCQHMSKKVLLLFGAWNRKAFHESHNVQDIVVQIETAPVKMSVLRNEKSEIQYLAIYAWHPEYLLRNRTSAAAKHYDAALNAAAALTGVQLDATFFTRRASQTKTRTAELEHSSTVSGVALNCERQTQSAVGSTGLSADPGRTAIKKGPKLKTLKFRETMKYWADLPIDHYSPNQRAVVLAAERDDAFPAGQILSRPNMFTDTTQTYFYRPSHNARTTEGSSTVPLLTTTSPALENSTTGNEAEWTVQPIVSRSKNTIINTAVVHVGRTIALKCIVCGQPPERKPVTTKPEFCTISHVAGRYIARAQVCTTPGCQVGWNPEYGRSGRRQMMVPQDESIPYIRSDQLQELDY